MRNLGPSYQSRAIEPDISSCQFIASGSIDMDVDLYDSSGLYLGQETWSLTTTAAMADDLSAGLVGSASGIVVRSVTAASAWYLPNNGLAGLTVTSATGTQLHTDMCIGALPPAIREHYALSSRIQTLIDSASALDTRIVKSNNSEYTRVPVRGLVLSTAGVTTLVAAHATKYNEIVGGTIHIASGGTTESFRITDGTIDLFGSSSGVKPVDISSATGPFGYALPNMRTGAVNRAISIAVTGAGSLVADFDYIQTTD